MRKKKTLEEYIANWDGTVKWTTMHGDVLMMKDMTNSHLNNA